MAVQERAKNDVREDDAPRRRVLYRLVPPIFRAANDDAPGSRTTPGDAAASVVPDDAKGGGPRRLGTLGRVLDQIVFSSLTRRIIILNVAALLVLLTGILYLNQYREGLIEARVAALRTQGQIISAAIAASASVETNAITIDPEVLLEMSAGETVRPAGDPADLNFAINPEEVAPVLRRLIVPVRTRARLYDSGGTLLVDTEHLYSEGQVLRANLPSIEGDEPGMLARLKAWLDRVRGVYREPDVGAAASSGLDIEEVRAALDEGRPATAFRSATDGGLVISVAVPVQRFRATIGVLLLSTQGQGIDAIIESERQGVLNVFAVAFLVTTILSLVLASTIASPLRNLSQAAMRVRSAGVENREEIPDYADRGDEIGDLSASLRAMTGALYDRIDAIERFAGDVSHELKNPLTSLRSAVETLPLAKTDESRERLLDIINHDVQRLNRLISDIADASRLDAELAFQNADPIDLTVLVSDLVEINRQLSMGRGVAVELHVESSSRPYLIFGHDLRIGQVITNLVDNARSFVQRHTGRIDVAMHHLNNGNIEITVTDNGPGIPEDAKERIFERFYTDRPGEGEFGQNSGLGLAISRQIIEAHGGSLTAGNAVDADGNVTGAEFRIVLPSARNR